jgi:hypothetical protein
MKRRSPHLPAVAPDPISHRADEFSRELELAVARGQDERVDSMIFGSRRSEPSLSTAAFEALRAGIPFGQIGSEILRESFADFCLRFDRLDLLRQVTTAVPAADRESHFRDLCSARDGSDEPEYRSPLAKASSGLSPAADLKNIRSLLDLMFECDADRTEIHQWGSSSELLRALAEEASMRLIINRGAAEAGCAPTGAQPATTRRARMQP